MQAMAEEVAVERRQEVSEQRDVWDDLTLAQKFAASSLTQFGYELAFVRDCHGKSLAVLVCNNNIATISKVGEINTAPNIQLRS